MGESSVKVLNQRIDIFRMLRLYLHFHVAFPYRRRHFALTHILANHSVAGVNRLSHIRKDILTMITEAGSGHPGGSLSCTDILTALYFGGVMDYNPADPHKPGRDRFILAKGHAAPALYATLAHAGFFPTDELHTLRKLGTRLQGHPDSNLLPGVEVSTGSLGQGLSVAAGLAAGLRLTGEDGLVFTVLGDGECEEGQVWEAAMFAGNHDLDNLVAIVDHNGLQIDGSIDEVNSAMPLADKFRAFKWHVIELADGNDMAQIAAAFAEARKVSDSPVAIIAETVKGKGVSFMENQVGWHGKAPNDEQFEQATAELAAAGEEL